MRKKRSINQPKRILLDTLQNQHSLPDFSIQKDRFSSRVLALHNTDGSTKLKLGLMSGQVQVRNEREQ
jgi:hypothetical protein